MSRAKSLFTTAIVFFCLQSQATNDLFLFGGAGDAPDVENHFYPTFDAFGKYAIAHQWVTQTLFGGDHTGDGNLQSSIGSPVRPFTSGNFTGYLQYILDQAKSGNLTHKDKVLIVINSHGSPTVTQDGHAFSCSDGICSPQKLKLLVKTLEAKQIPTAIVDFSCFSGNSQKLKSSNTCVISATRKDDISFASFANNFSNALKPGRSLEEAYLEARRNPTTIGYPEISSPAGVATDTAISKIADNVKFCAGKSYCSKSKQSSCQAHKNALTTLLKNLQDAQGKTAAETYVNTSQDYQQIYSRLQKSQKNYSQYASRVVVGDHGSHITWGELSNYVAFKDQDRLAKGFPEIYRQFYDLNYKNPDYKKMLQLQQELQDAGNTDISYDSEKNKFISKSPLTTAALKVQQAEQSLYDKVYRDESARSTKTPNPCATFTL